MPKESKEQGDLCPDCVNGNENEEADVTMNPYNDDDGCCSCCCCSCSSAESGVEEFPLRSDNPNEASVVGRAMIQKKDLLSKLSIVQTNREQASIQNILQFVEALSHSNNFLRRYYMEEDFCLQCIQDSVCECNLRELANINLNDSCTCSACEGNKSDVSAETGNVNHGCSDSPPSKKPTSGRYHYRRNRRRRRRPRNSENVMQRRRPIESTREHQYATPEGYDSDCSECQRNKSSDKPSSKINDRESCDCEECIRLAESNTNLNYSPCSPNPTADHRTTSPYDCDSRPLHNHERCTLSKCVDCKMASSDESTCNENGCTSDCAECRVSLPRESSCECCINQHRVNSAESSNTVCESTFNSVQRGLASDCNSCDCDECQYVSECSNDSCEECANQKSEKKN